MQFHVYFFCLVWGGHMGHRLCGWKLADNFWESALVVRLGGQGLHPLSRLPDSVVKMCNVYIIYAHVCITFLPCLGSGNKLKSLLTPHKFFIICLFFFLLVSERRSCSIDLVGLEHTIEDKADLAYRNSPVSDCWDYRYVPPHLFFPFVFFR